MLILALIPALAEVPAATALSINAFVHEFRQDGVPVADDVVETDHQAACAAGVTVHCTRPWKRGNLDEAAAALEGACKEGQPGPCLVVAWSQVQETPGKVDATIEHGDAALKLFTAVCKQGIDRACVDQGVLYTRGVGGKGVEGIVEAQALFQTACQVGDLSGCRRLGALYHAGRGIDRDFEKAREYYGKACDGGYATGCNGLALLDHLGGDGKKDPESAERLYTRACDAGLPSACNNLERLYDVGVNPNEDPAAAMAIWQRGCEAGVAAACANGGRLATDDRMATKDPALALTLFEKGCKKGDPFTCWLYGAALLPSDPTKGVGLVQSSCLTGIAPACHDLAGLLKAGKLVPKDKKRAKALLQQACADGHEPSCP